MPRKTRNNDGVKTTSKDLILNTAAAAGARAHAFFFLLMHVGDLATYIRFIKFRLRRLIS